MIEALQKFSEAIVNSGGKGQPVTIELPEREWMCLAFECEKVGLLRTHGHCILVPVYRLSAFNAPITPDAQSPCVETVGLSEHLVSHGIVVHTICGPWTIRLEPNARESWLLHFGRKT